LSATLSTEAKFFGETARMNLNGRDIRLYSQHLYESQWPISRPWPSFIKLHHRISWCHDELDHSPGTIALKMVAGTAAIMACATLSKA
jgi:peptidyl-tRNA hydrolase